MASKIILASAHRFHSNIRLGTSHLAEALRRRGWDVLFIEQPSSPFHLIHPASRDVATRKFAGALGRGAARKGDGMSAPGGSLDLLNVVSLLPHVNAPLFRSRFTLANWWRLTFPPIGREIARRGFADASALMFDSPFFFPLSALTGLPTVYRYADRLGGFTEITPAMLELQERVLDRVDLVAYTALALENDLKARSRSTLYLPNGVDLEAFAGAQAEPPELAAIPRPRAIYSGAFGPWFDVDILRGAAAVLPQVQFVLLGPMPEERLGLANLPNVHFLGEKPFADVPRYLLHSQAAIIPFDTIRMPSLVEAINPLKLYEYCAAGLPVVSYESNEFDALRAPVETYRSQAEFVDALRRAIETDTEESRNHRMAWASEASWDLRAARLEEALARL